MGEKRKIIVVGEEKKSRISGDHIKRFMRMGRKNGSLITLHITHHNNTIQSEKLPLHKKQPVLKEGECYSVRNANRKQYMV